MSEEVTYQVRLLGSNGKKHIIPYEALKQKLGVCTLQSKIDCLNRRVEELREIAIDQFLAYLKDPFLKYMRKNPDIRTGDLHAKLTEMGIGFSDLYRIALWRLFKGLEESGEIVPTSHGGGYHRTWRVKE